MLQSKDSTTADAGGFFPGEGGSFSGSRVGEEQSTSFASSRCPSRDESSTASSDSDESSQPAVKRSREKTTRANGVDESAESEDGAEDDNRRNGE